MKLYARLCGWTLARAHARSGDRFAIAAYLGKSDRFDQAVADFATTYADQNDRDHESTTATTNLCPKLSPQAAWRPGPASDSSPL
jgi:hypothetical protein